MLTFCNFFVCTFANGEDKVSTLHIERIYGNAKFQNEHVSRQIVFFELAYTHPPSTAVSSKDQQNQNEKADKSEQLYLSHQSEYEQPANSRSHDQIHQLQQISCYCMGPDAGRKTACDNAACAIE